MQHKNGLGEYWLFCEIYDPTAKYAGALRLMRIYDHEKTLENGRFSYYSQDFFVNAQSCIFVEPVYIGYEYHYDITEYVNWISEHSENEWNYRVSAYQWGQHKCPMIFSFSDPRTAMLFKLVFG